MDDQGIAEQWLKPRPHGPLGFTRLTPTEADDRGDLRLGPGGRARARPLVRPSDRRPRRSKLGFPERRWGVPLIDGGTQRLPRIVGMGRALELILTGRMSRPTEALGMGLLTEVVAPGEHLDRALEMAEGLAAFPQETMLADRRAALEGIGLAFEEARAGGRDRPRRRARRRRGRRPLRRRRGPRRRGRRRLANLPPGIIEAGRVVV